MSPIRPERTVAMLVGVERYGIGGDWDLDGPALDACRVADWLVGQGVPEDNVHLLVSPLASNKAEVEACAVAARPADSATFSRVLLEEVREQECDLFLLWWGGHGVLDGEREKRLFLPDLTNEVKLNVNVSDLLASMGTEFFPAHARQLVVVDACQTLVERLRLLHTLPNQTYQRAADRPERIQEVLFAASAGQEAWNLADRQAGVFSDAVLRVWQRQGWPPSAEHWSEIDDLVHANSPMGQAPFVWLRGARDEVLRPFASRLNPQRNRRSVPPLKGSPPAMGRIRDAMLAVDELRDEHERQAVLAFLPDELRGVVPYSRTGHLHLLNLILACASRAGGRQALLQALRIGVAGSVAADHMFEVIQQEWPQEAGDADHG